MARGQIWQNFPKLLRFTALFPSSIVPSTTHKIEHKRVCPELLKVEEEFAGPEKLGLAPKVLQNLWGSAEPFWNKLSTMGNVLQNLPAEPQRFRRIVGNLWEPNIQELLEWLWRLFRDVLAGCQSWIAMSLVGKQVWNRRDFGISCCTVFAPASLKCPEWKRACLCSHQVDLHFTARRFIGGRGCAAEEDKTLGSRGRTSYLFGWLL